MADIVDTVSVCGGNTGTGHIKQTDLSAENADGGCHSHPLRRVKAIGFMLFDKVKYDLENSLQLANYNVDSESVLILQQGSEN